MDCCSSTVIAGLSASRAYPSAASSAAVLGALAPIMLSAQGPGLEILQPMAVVIAGGLTASALVNLFVMPVLYLAVGPVGDRDAQSELSHA